MICDICELPIDEDDDESWHRYHEDDCPNRPGQLSGEWKTSCGCNGVAHVECCPACAPWVIHCEWMGRWTLWWSGSRAGWKVRRDAAHVYSDRHRALVSIERMKPDDRAKDIRAIPLSMAMKMEEGGE